MKWFAALVTLAALSGLALWSLAPSERTTTRAGLEPEGPARTGSHDLRTRAAEELALPEASTALAAEAHGSRQSVRELATVDGRVLEKSSGTPLEGFDVRISAPGQLLDSAQSDAQGRFSFGTLGPERDHTVRVDPPDGWLLDQPRKQVRSGPAQSTVSLEFRARRWPPQVAGNISGWLKAESGSFQDRSLAQGGKLILDLVSTEHPPITRRARLGTVRDDDNRIAFSFEFKDVPAGEYNLTLSSLANYRWEPTSVLVSPPAANIEFLCYDLDEVFPLAFEVFDAETRERIYLFNARHIKQTSSPEHGVFLHTGPVEGQRFPLDVPFVWSVDASGYATAYGDERNFSLERDRRIARVDLERGWSTRFLVMGGEPSMQPLVGAEIYLNGELAGGTDGTGALNAKSEEPPEKVDVRYLDWVLHQPIELNSRRRSQVTPVLMEAKQ